MDNKTYTLEFTDSGNAVVAAFNVDKYEKPESEASLSFLYIITILYLIRTGKMEQLVAEFLESNFDKKE